MARKTELALQDALYDLFNDIADAHDTDEEDRDEVQAHLAGYPGYPAIQEVSTFEEAMVLTRNAGLVVRLANGQEFQITIVQSAGPVDTE